MELLSGNCFILSWFNVYPCYLPPPLLSSLTSCFSLFSFSLFPLFFASSLFLLHRFLLFLVQFFLLYLLFFILLPVLALLKCIETSATALKHKCEHTYIIMHFLILPAPLPWWRRWLLWWLWWSCSSVKETICRLCTAIFTIKCWWLWSRLTLMMMMMMMMMRTTMTMMMIYVICVVVDGGGDADASDDILMVMTRAIVCTVCMLILYRSIYP